MAHGEISDYVLTCCRISVFSPPANNKRQTMNSKFTTKALSTHRSTKYRMFTLQLEKPTLSFPSEEGNIIVPLEWRTHSLIPKFTKPAQLANSFHPTCHLDYGS